MNRRDLVIGAASAAALLVCAPSIAGPAIHPHKRLADVWSLMAQTAGGPGAMRAAVERHFGRGLLRFVDRVDRSGAWPDVLLDTTSIDFWLEDGWPVRTHATAQVMIVGGGLSRSDRWINGPCLRCDSRGRSC